LAVATATLLLGGRPLLAELRRALETAARAERRSPLGRFAFLALHLACFASFFSLSRSFANVSENMSPYSALLAGAWLASGLTALVSLSQALVPLAALLAVVRSTGRALALGTALGIVAWAGGVATVRVWDPLGEATLHAVAVVLRLAGPDIWMDPATSTLGFERFRVVIEPACSGYEGIGLLTVLTGVYLWAFRTTLRFPNVLAIVPIGIGLAWLANVVRIAALMVVGARWSTEMALGSFHSKAGWVLFCGIALGLVALTQRTSLFSRDVRAHIPTANPTAAYLAPLLALLAIHMTTGLLSMRLPILYPLGVLAGAAMLWRQRGEYPWLFRPAWSWEACALGVGAYALWIALEPSSAPGAEHEWQGALATLPLPLVGLWLAFRALGSVIVVPLAEELAFRGYLLRRLVSADFTSVPFSRFGWVSFLGSSAAFGLLHDRWLAGILAGMLFALAQQRRGRLTDAVLAHAITNLLLALHVIGWQQWSLWT
jgi:exosortase E/protease (VPEID-CTERM system)